MSILPDRQGERIFVLLILVEFSVLLIQSDLSGLGTRIFSL